MSVVIVGTLDTKGEEIGFARDVLEGRGVDVHLVDVGVMGEPTVEPDTPSSEVATLADTSLEALREAGDRGEANTLVGSPVRRLPLVPVYGRSRVTVLRWPGRGGYRFLITGLAL